MRGGFVVGTTEIGMSRLRGRTPMTRSFLFVRVLALTLVTFGALAAQSTPQVTIRKLNVAKSKFDPPSIAPQGETRTIETQGDSVKASTNGIAADGSRIAYSYTTKYDGKDSPISGVGFPLGADTVAEKRVDVYTTTSIAKKAGKVVLTTRSVVSKDGKLTTITAKGKTKDGKPVRITLVWDAE
jgi:hypothetical protein